MISTVDLIIFSATAALTLISALAVVLNRHPVYSALFLVLTFLGLSSFFLQLSAPFLAAVQVIVYAGAIMVLFLFVIMLLGEDGPIASENKLVPQLRVPLVLALILAGLIGLSISRSPKGEALGAAGTVPTIGGDPASFGSVKAIGTTLFTQYLFAFEATSVVLLVAMIGVVVLAKRKL